MDEQDRVMQPAGPELCKVVLATNIAESSVTIPDAHFVIDAGLQRGIFLDERTSKPALLCRWVSQASARQRAGRTGRVAPGTVVHLFTRRFHDTELLQHDEAEMSHASLEKTVITTKLLLSKFGSIHDLLAMVITPPTPERIQASLEELCKYGAFTTSTEDAQVCSPPIAFALGIPRMLVDQEQDQQCQSWGPGLTGNRRPNAPGPCTMVMQHSAAAVAEALPPVCGLGGAYFTAISVSFSWCRTLLN